MKLGRKPTSSLKEGGEGGEMGMQPSSSHVPYSTRTHIEHHARPDGGRSDVLPLQNVQYRFHGTNQGDPPAVGWKEKEGNREGLLL